MTQYLKNRTDNDIKNKWYSMYRSASVQRQKTKDASDFGHVTKHPSSKSIEVANGANSTSHTDGSADFPPPFSLTPITRKAETNLINHAPPNESECLKDAVMSFSCSWGDLSF